MILQKSKLFKELLSLIFACAIVASVFLFYMFFIGNKKTLAAYYYSLAEKNYSMQNYNKSKEYFLKSLSSFAEPLVEKIYNEYFYSAK